MNSPDDAAHDRSLIEEAITLVLADAPAGWTQVTAEFDVATSPPAARASAMTGAKPVPVPVPSRAPELVADYAHRVGAPWHRVIVDVDATGGVSMRTDPPAVAGPHPRRRLGVWLWALAALVSVAVLVVAIVGRDRGDGPSLRPMTASESMSDEQARAVAENTVRAWVREGNQGHADNLEALMCPDAVGAVADKIRATKQYPLPAGPVVAFGDFIRRGPVWTLYTHLEGDHGMAIVLEIRNGELLVCAVGSARVP